MFSKLPDRTFVFAVLALLMAIAAFAYLALWPSFEIVETSVDGALTARRVGVAEANGILGLVFALMPVVIILGAILSVPPSGNAERRHKLNLIVGAALLWIFIVTFAQQIGILYVPAATMLTSVVVLILVRDRAWGSRGAQERTKSARELQEETTRRAQRSGNRVGRRRRVRRRSR
jgi:hypothetical protein